MDGKAKLRREATLNVSRMLASGELRRSLRAGVSGELCLITLLSDDTIGDMAEQVSRRGGRASVAVWDQQGPGFTVLSVQSHQNMGRHRASEDDSMHRDALLGMLVEYIRSANPGAIEVHVTGGETVVELDFDSDGRSLSL